MTPDELAAIRGRCDAATPGPWAHEQIRPSSDWWFVVGGVDLRRVIVNHVCPRCDDFSDDPLVCSECGYRWLRDPTPAERLAVADRESRIVVKAGR